MPEEDKSSPSKEAVGTLVPATLSSALILSVALLVAWGSPASVHKGDVERAYLGFDRNLYPGDDALPLLRQTFAFASFWLNPPPGEKINTWQGKREILRAHGFGFLILFRGRESRELTSSVTARTIGTRDGKDTVATAKEEGFAPGATIFLDIEEGGRLPDAYHVYLAGWADELDRAEYRSGIYCSGILVTEGPGVSITTAEEIRKHAKPRQLAVWVFNDVCPPAPGCAFPENPPLPRESGIPYATLWQFAQSPRQKARTRRCQATYFRDGNCYAPGDRAHTWILDVNTATSPDPSGGAK